MRPCPASTPHLLSHSGFFLVPFKWQVPPHCGPRPTPGLILTLARAEDEEEANRKRSSIRDQPGPTGSVAGRVSAWGLSVSRSTPAPRRAPRRALSSFSPLPFSCSPVLRPCQRVCAGHHLQQHAGALERRPRGRPQRAGARLQGEPGRGPRACSPTQGALSTGPLGPGLRLLEQTQEICPASPPPVTTATRASSLRRGEASREGPGSSGLLRVPQEATQGAPSLTLDSTGPASVSVSVIFSNSSPKPSLAT